MKNIRLRIPRVINGVVKHPADGTIAVDDDIAEQLIEDEAADDAEVDVDVEHDDGLDDKNLADLKQIAADEQVEIGDSRTKPEFIHVIRAHRAAQQA